MNITALDVGNKLTNYLTDNISHNQTFNCHVNIVLSVYIELLGEEVNRTKTTLLVISFALE